MGSTRVPTRYLPVAKSKCMGHGCVINRDADVENMSFQEKHGVSLSEENRSLGLEAANISPLHIDSTCGVLFINSPTTSNLYYDWTFSFNAPQERENLFTVGYLLDPSRNSSKRRVSRGFPSTVLESLEIDWTGRFLGEIAWVGSSGWCKTYPDTRHSIYGIL